MGPVVINLVTGSIGRLSLIVSVTLYVLSLLAAVDRLTSHVRLLIKKVVVMVSRFSFKCGHKWSGDRYCAVDGTRRVFLSDRTA